MAFRPDVSIDWRLSPRIITVASPSVEITMQDLLDTLRELEDDLPNLSYPKIVSAAGKETLGGGVTVGITVTLLNAKLAFEARPGPAYIQCNVSGGNLVAVDDVGGVITPISPTAFTQIVLANSSSATTQELVDIQYSSFNGGVTIDADNTHGNAVAGTTYPTGTPRQPCLNVSDAITIANRRGFPKLYLISDLTLGTGDNVIDFTVVGESHVHTNLTIEDGAVCNNITVIECRLNGILDGNTTANNCLVGDITYVNGHVHDSGLYGTIILGGGLDAVLNNCHTPDQASVPTIDMGGSGQSLAMSNYSGIAYIKNLTDPTQTIGVGLNHGMIVLEDTLSEGFAIVAGVGIVEDNTTGNAVVNLNGLMSKATVADAVSDKMSNLQQIIEADKVVPAFGDIFFRDPVNGDDSSDGLTKRTPVKSFAAAEALVQDGHSDVVFLINTTGSLEQLDEQWDVQKAYSIRGPGSNSIELFPTSTSGPTVRIRKSSFDLHGIKIRTSATDGAGGDQYCIDMDAGVNNCHFNRLKIARGIEGGMIVRDGDDNLIEDCIVEHFSGKVGIDFYGDGHENVLVDNFIYDMSTGVRFNDTCQENWIKAKNLFHDMGTGVMIQDASCGHLYIDRETTFENLGVELNNDIGGTGIHFVRNNDNTDIAGAVWANASAVTLISDVDFIKNIEGGRWKIVSNQMIFYKEDNATEVARFNLFDNAGSPTMENVFERQKV